MLKKVRKVVIPAAGLGTRFLPATKAQPKEMLPIVDKPVIQYVVEQAVEAGIEQVIIVTGWHKRAIEDHFDRHYELESRLAAAGKEKQLAEIRKLSELANFVYVRQQEPLGNGHAVLTARDIVGDEPFLVIWGDGFFHSKPGAPAQLIEAYNQYQASVIAGIRIERKQDLNLYGIADIEPVQNNLYKIKKVVEKPKADEAPSNLAVHGAYLLTPDIFDVLANQKPSQQGEIWLPEAIDALSRQQDVYALELKNAKYYDCGKKLEYLKAVVDFGLEHQELREEFRKYLKDLIK